MRFNLKVLCIIVAGIFLGWRESAWAASYINEITDSSVGKTPLIIASAAGGFEALEGWNSLSRSFRGKPPTVVLYDGPPPRDRTVHNSDNTAASFFYLYADHGSRVNHFQPTGYMGDYKDVQVDEKNTEDPANGRTCIKITYVPSDEGKEGWAGLYWLDPKTNWGYKPGGFNLSHRKRLTFWARGAKGGEQIANFKVGGIGGPHADTGSAAIGPVWLTKEWQHYVIDLRDTDLSKVSGGFAWSTSGSDNEGPLVFYLDEIRFE